MAQRGMWMAVLAAGVQLFVMEQSSTAAAKNCLTAADCGGAPATCRLTTYQTCAGKDPSCPAGSACGDKPTMNNQADCAPYVEGTCYQQYELPCQIDADCGGGFRCVEQIGRACSGMGSTGGNGMPPWFHEECYETRGTFACELIEASCKVDSDCAAGLRCQQSSASKCGETFAPTVADAEPSDTNCAQEPMRCAPEGYFGVRASSPPAGDDDVIAAGDSAQSMLEGGAHNGEPTARTDDGCSLSGALARRSALGWLALASALLLERRRGVHKRGVRQRLE
ncbi:MAG TPA: hypothetical protein VI299_02805 [Polyangiales bacterium]